MIQLFFKSLLKMNEFVSFKVNEKETKFLESLASSSRLWAEFIRINANLSRSIGSATDFKNRLYFANTKSKHSSDWFIYKFGVNLHISLTKYRFRTNSAKYLMRGSNCQSIKCQLNSKISKPPSSTPWRKSVKIFTRQVAIKSARRT